MVSVTLVHLHCTVFGFGFLIEPPSTPLMQTVELSATGARTKQKVWDNRDLI